MKEIMLPEIVAVGIYNAQLAVKNREITKNRKTTMFEIELPIGGGGVSYIDKESMPVNENMIICAKPGQVRHTRLPFKCYFIHIIVKEGELYDMLTEVPSYLKISDRDRYEKIYLDLCKYYETGLYSDKIMLHSLILELIYRLHKSSQRQLAKEKAKGGSDEMIKKVIKHIKNNLSSDLSLKTLSEFSSFSPIHFHNCFKASTGKTLREYVEEQRLQKAINLLVSADMTLSEIAYECGFSSQSYFSYAFKKRMGITPRKYAQEVYERYEK